MALPVFQKIVDIELQHQRTNVVFISLVNQIVGNFDNSSLLDVFVQDAVMTSAKKIAPVLAWCIQSQDVQRFKQSRFLQYVCAGSFHDRTGAGGVVHGHSKVEPKGCSQLTDP